MNGLWRGWQEALDLLLEQGYPRSTINLAVPYYSGNSAWADLCSACPDLAPESVLEVVRSKGGHAGRAAACLRNASMQNSVHHFV